MLRPRDSHDLKLRSAVLTIAPAAQVSWMHDVFGNSVTLLEFAEPAAELRMESRIELEQFPLDRPDYRLAPGCGALAVRLRRRGAPRPRPHARPRTIPDGDLARLGAGPARAGASSAPSSC